MADKTTPESAPEEAEEDMQQEEDMDETVVVDMEGTDDNNMEFEGRTTKKVNVQARSDEEAQELIGTIDRLSRDVEGARMRLRKLGEEKERYEREMRRAQKSTREWQDKVEDMEGRHQQTVAALKSKYEGERVLLEQRLFEERSRFEDEWGRKSYAEEGLHDELKAQREQIQRLETIVAQQENHRRGRSHSRDARESRSRESTYRATSNQRTTGNEGSQGTSQEAPPIPFSAYSDEGTRGSSDQNPKAPPNSKPRLVRTERFRFEPDPPREWTAEWKQTKIPNIIFKGDGTTSVTEYILKLRNHQRSYRMSEERMMDVIPSTLEGMAQGWFADIQFSSEVQTLEGFYEALKQQFLSASAKSKVRAELRALVQKPEQPVSDYANKIYEKARIVCLTDQEKLEVLVEGLLPHLREHYTIARPKTFMSAVRSLEDFEVKNGELYTRNAVLETKMKKVEAIVDQTSSKKYKAVSSLQEMDTGMNDQFQAMEKQNEQTHKQLQALQNQIQNMQKNNSSQKEMQSNSTKATMECYNCHKKGHLAKDCRSAPFCTYCKTPGHKREDCRKKRDGIYCAHCKTGSHNTADCKLKTQKQQQAPNQ
jgi:hypothetical protein